MIEYIVFGLVMIFLFPGPLFVAMWQESGKLARLRAWLATFNVQARIADEHIRQITAAQNRMTELADGEIITHDAVWSALPGDVRYALASPAQRRRFDENQAEIRRWRGDCADAPVGGFRRSRDDEWEVA